jgi:hypothetical protein
MLLIAPEAFAFSFVIGSFPVYVILHRNSYVSFEETLMRIILLDQIKL